MHTIKRIALTLLVGLFLLGSVADEAYGRRSSSSSSRRSSFSSSRRSSSSSSRRSTSPSRSTSSSRKSTSSSRSSSSQSRAAQQRAAKARQAAIKKQATQQKAATSKFSGTRSSTSTARPGTNVTGTKSQTTARPATTTSQGSKFGSMRQSTSTNRTTTKKLSPAQKKLNQKKATANQGHASRADAVKKYQTQNKQTPRPGATPAPRPRGYSQPIMYGGVTYSPMWNPTRGLWSYGHGGVFYDPYDTRHSFLANAMMAHSGYGYYGTHRPVVYVGRSSRGGGSGAIIFVLIIGAAIAIYAFRKA